MFATTLAKAKDEINLCTSDLERRVAGLRDQLAALDLQEGRLVDAIATGVAVDRVKSKLEEIAKARQEAEAALEGCKVERAEIEQALQNVDLFGDLRVYFEGVDDKNAFVDVPKVLRTIVSYVTVDIPAGKLSVSLNVPFVQSKSIRENAQNATATRESIPNVAVSPKASVVDRPKTTGEGDGARTRNHQIDSLVL